MSKGKTLQIIIDIAWLTVMMIAIIMDHADKSIEGLICTISLMIWYYIGKDFAKTWSDD